MAMKSSPSTFLSHSDNHQDRAAPAVTVAVDIKSGRKTAPAPILPGATRGKYGKTMDLPTLSSQLNPLLSTAGGIGFDPYQHF